MNISVYSQYSPPSLDYIADVIRRHISKYSALYMGGGGIVISDNQVER